MITGATGLIGNELTTKLQSEGHHVSILSRGSSSFANGIKTYHWNPDKGEIDTEAFEGVEAVVNLAGAGVADKRWTDEYKKLILNSRINSTKLLINTLKKIPNSISSFINASAIGYYGFDTKDKWVDENTLPGNDFLADTVKKWESEALRAQQIGLRTVIIRIGIVLSEKGGALPKMALPTQYYVGAALGTGKQYLSWIDIEDLIGIFIHSINTPHVSGIFNAVAPEPVTNGEFNEELAKALGKPIILPNIPSMVLRLLVGEMSDVLLGGNRVSSKKIQESGFHFKSIPLGKSLEKLKSL